MSQDKKPEAGLNAIPPAPEATPLLSELRQLIDEARHSAVVAVNAGLTLLYWRVGQRIRVEVLGGERAGYGEEIVSTLSRQLAWSHFRELIYLQDPLVRDFYAEMCRIERWSVRTLRERVGSMLFERTALSKRPDELIRLELDALHAHPPHHRTSRRSLRSKTPEATT